MLSSIALVVVLVVDQLRTDELFRVQLNPNGIGRLVDRGLFYEDTHHGSFHNSTCSGHASISSGALPGLTGIMMNSEFDRDTHEMVYCTADSQSKWLDAADDKDGDGQGTSPARILVSNLSDELKTTSPDSKVFAIAVKDRSAIALAGHHADGAYWFAPKSGHWTTSTYYEKTGKMPEWLTKVNAQFGNKKVADEDSFIASHRAVTQTTDLALDILKREKLGTRKSPDILWISYSTHDIVGHSKGDDSKELRDTLILEDNEIARLLKAIEKQLGRKKILVALTADHGAGIVAKDYIKNGIPAGRLPDPKVVTEKVNKCLAKEGVGSSSQPALEKFYGPAFYLRKDTKDVTEARKKLRNCVLTEAPYHVAYTREEILTNMVAPTPWLRTLPAAYHPSRGADVIAVLRPYWNTKASEPVQHETPYPYDSWVPLAIWGPGIKAAKISRQTEVASLAPTLSQILKTKRPSGAFAPLLPEVLEYTRK